MLWTGDCPSARVHGLLLAWRARLSMGDTFFGAWQRNRSTGGARQRRKRCAAEQTAAVSLNRSESDLWLARPKLGLLKADRGGCPLHTPLHRSTPSARSLQAKISGPAPARSLTYSHTLSLLAGLDDLDVLVVGSTGPTAGGRLRRQHASAFTKHRGSVIIHDSGFFQVISTSWPRCGPAANNGGAMGTAGTARRWTAWGHGAWSRAWSVERESNYRPHVRGWGHVLGAFGGSRDRGTNSRQLTARRSRSHGSGAEFGWRPSMLAVPHPGCEQRLRRASGRGSEQRASVLGRYQQIRSASNLINLFMRPRVCRHRLNPRSKFQGARR